MSAPTWDVRHGDCRELMAAMPAASVDAIVTDPPYGLAFMGKGWDHAVPGIEFWTEALRVAKPGTHLLAFGGTRTFHRLACAIEDAGWEIRDTLSWLYGSGFPKSHNGPWGGTALKPAWEPIIMARKPLAGTVAANVAAHGTGGLNIDGCRIGAGRDYHDLTVTQGLSSARTSYEPRKESRTFAPAAGRWPANVALDEDAAAMLDAQSGESASNWRRSKGAAVGAADGYGFKTRSNVSPDDSGGASRFFYCAKASRSEREAGLEAVAVKAVHRYGAGLGEGKDPNAPALNRNHHPTVKPVALMRWLVRLVTPAGGVVLDPFTGSGTTGVAAVQEGRRFIGCEREAEYVEIARRRIAHHAPVQGDLLTGAA